MPRSPDKNFGVEPNPYIGSGYFNDDTAMQSSLNGVPFPGEPSGGGGQLFEGTSIGKTISPLVNAFAISAAQARSLSAVNKLREAASWDSPHYYQSGYSTDPLEMMQAEQQAQDVPYSPGEIDSRHLMEIINRLERRRR